MVAGMDDEADDCQKFRCTHLQSSGNNFPPARGAIAPHSWKIRQEAGLADQALHVVMIEAPAAEVPSSIVDQFSAVVRGPCAVVFAVNSEPGGEHFRLLFR